MAIPVQGGKSDEVVRREAADWSALFHDPDGVADREAFERWRAADPRHAAAYARVERGWDQSALLAQTRYGRERSLPARRAWLVRPQVRYAAIAATVLLAIAGLSIGAPLLEQRFGAGPPELQLASEVGQIRKVELSDGSTVTLDTASALRVAFSAGERRLYLAQGRGRFDVAHDNDRPFIVLAGTGSVVALGTVFDVSIAGDRVDVTLLQGTVEVRNGVAPSPTQAVERLRPGQKISFAGSTPLTSPHAAPDAERLWTSGMLTFNGTPLEDAIEEANRYSNVKISIADPELNKLQISGAYQARDTVGLAQSLAASFSLQINRSIDGKRILLSATRAQTPS